ncbi:MAG: signal peptidase I [Gammaproteobacteria bacterium]|nr:signal peptidase I [Gammaproteobacteria bacterium]MBI5614750.1 signal peptidase I [Gammaproteobacteria bacterium]
MIWDFSLVMVLLVLVSGLIWAFDALVLAPRRTLHGESSLPIVVEYAKSFFPIFVLVLLLRSFLVEPFRIPSGSMVPTLLVGDFILVNKFTYGIRLPVLNRKVIEINQPQRGDVVVFRYPEDPSTPFIKRIIGLPGDKIEYRDRRVYVNGREFGYEETGTYIGVRSAAAHTGNKLLNETLDNGVTHHVIVNPGVMSFNNEYTVPQGQYFVLGDNRDNSRDSRYWGFVPDQNLIGRAFMIWMNWDRGPDLSRIGTKIR